jgi:ABC-type phosphate transport system substrate-binding protein
MRLATPLATAAIAIALLAGCGSSSDSSDQAGSTAAPKASGSSAPAGASAQACAIDAGGTSGLRVTSVSCGKGQKVAIAWRKDASCRPAAGGSEAGCTVAGYRCVAQATDRGLAVSCARPGHSIAFTAKRE